MPSSCLRDSSAAITLLASCAGAPSSVVGSAACSGCSPCASRRSSHAHGSGSAPRSNGNQAYRGPGQAAAALLVEDVDVDVLTAAADAMLMRTSIHGPCGADT